MISLKRYLDSPQGPEGMRATNEPDPLELAVEDYGQTLETVGNCCAEACAVTGDLLKRELGDEWTALAESREAGGLRKTGDRVREKLNEWGHATAKHYQEKASEVKELLLAMARTAESVGARDARCAGQMNEVTDRLQAIASLEDLTQIRSSIKKSAQELKTSIERMTAEGKATLDAMREQVSTYQAKLDEAEAIALRDALTALGSRLYVEGEIEKRIASAGMFCVVLIDIDGFKQVNDGHGHLAGDELLKQFAGELRSACRATDVIGRWGGDEFLLVFDCGMAEAETKTERLKKWICGSYIVHGKQGEVKLQVDASFGLAAHEAGEAMKQLLERADAAMYTEKHGAHRGKLERRQVAV
jgi:diguanylate cyclase (GGDEF)-like protein